MPSTIWTAERDEQFRAMFADGSRYCDMSEVFGVSPEAIRQHRRYLKLTRLVSPMRRKKTGASEAIKVNHAQRVARRKNASAILRPLNGLFDSNAALHRLLERWVA